MTTKRLPEVQNWVLIKKPTKDQKYCFIESQKEAQIPENEGKKIILELVTDIDKITERERETHGAFGEVDKANRGLTLLR